MEPIIELVKNDLFIQKDSDICANPNLFDPESFRYFITAFFESFPEYLLKWSEYNSNLEFVFKLLKYFSVSILKASGE